MWILWMKKKKKQENLSLSFCVFLVFLPCAVNILSLFIKEIVLTRPSWKTLFFCMLSVSSIDFYRSCVDEVNIHRLLDPATKPPAPAMQSGQQLQNQHNFDKSVHVVNRRNCQRKRIASFSPWSGGKQKHNKQINLLN